MHLLRNLFKPQTETEDEFRIRMEQLQCEFRDLSLKRPEEVAGDPMEPMFFALKMGESLESGDETQAKHCLNEMLRTDPTEAGLRLIASTAFTRLGDTSESIAQLGIGPALDPENVAIHPRLALLLKQRGELKAAESVLETGWVHCRKHTAKRDLEAERIRYFSVLESENGA